MAHEVFFVVHVSSCFLAGRLQTDFLASFCHAVSSTFSFVGDFLSGFPFCSFLDLLLLDFGLYTPERYQFPPCVECGLRTEVRFCYTPPS